MDKSISVVIPTFDRKELTDAAIASVATNNPSIVEIVVVDDFGLEPFDYPEFNDCGVSVSVIRLEANLGAGMARQVAVNHCRGRFIAFLDSDDTYDQSWIDSVIALISSNTNLRDASLLIVGRVYGGSVVSNVSRRFLELLPESFRLTFLRILTIFFNPFYTPSLVISKNICFFYDGLRHCEDYYSTAMAVFNADKAIISSNFACRLGRPPNSVGGESFKKPEMFKGELVVRRSFFGSPLVPIRYKFLIPLGILYQYTRAFLKNCFNLIKKFGL